MNGMKKKAHLSVYNVPLFSDNKIAKLRCKVDYFQEEENIIFAS